MHQCSRMSSLLPKVAKKQKGVISFDPQVFLATVGAAKTITEYPKDYKVFSQGDPSDAVFYIQQGRVKLKVKEIVPGLVESGGSRLRAR